MLVEIEDTVGVSCIRVVLRLTKSRVAAYSWKGQQDLMVVSILCHIVDSLTRCTFSIVGVERRSEVPAGAMLGDCEMLTCVLLFVLSTEFQHRLLLKCQTMLLLVNKGAPG